MLFCVIFEASKCTQNLVKPTLAARQANDIQYREQDKIERDRHERLLTAGGRVLGVVCTAPTLQEAVNKAYAEVEKVHFENAYYRHDIGARALQANR